MCFCKKQYIKFYILFTKICRLQKYNEAAAYVICGGLTLLFRIIIRILIRYLFHASPFYKFCTDLDLHLCFTVDPVC